MGSAYLPRFAEPLDSEPGGPDIFASPRAVATGRPLGSAAFATDLVARLGRPALPRKRGRKPKVEIGE